MGTRQKRINLVTPPVLLGLGMGLCVVLSGFASYRLGDSALQSVSQPEVNPTQKLLGQSTEVSGDERQETIAFTPINLEKVEKETRIYIQNQQKRQKVENPADAATDAESEEKDAEKK